jgi:hypothetical protein
MGLDYADEDDDFHGYDERYYPRPLWTWPPGIESHAEVPSQVRGGGACVSSRGRCKGKNMDSGTLYSIGDGARRSGRPGPHGQVMGDRARYGVDGGYGGIPVFLLAETGLLAGAQWAKRRDKRLIGSLAMGGAAAVLGVAASYFYSTGPGKLSAWKDLLDELDLRGDELVLDIGCGRGAVLISAARRLHKAGQPEPISGVCVTRREIAGPPPSETRKSRASASGSSWSTAMPGTFPFRASRSTWCSATWSSATLRAAKSEAGRCAKPSGSCAQADRCASSMIAPTA